LGNKLVPPKLLLAWPTTTDYETDEIIDAIYAQREPWRTRFLQLTAKAVSRNGNSRVPERVEVETWLRQSRSLRRQMAALLWMWNGMREMEPKRGEVCPQT